MLSRLCALSFLLIFATAVGAGEVLYVDAGFNMVGMSERFLDNAQDTTG